MTDIALWQLISPALPIGSYAYSQGLESAVEAKKIITEEESYQWISGILIHSIGKLDAPVYCRFYQAWKQRSEQKLLFWNDFLQASRESSEFLAEDQQLGTALLRLLKQLATEDDPLFDSLCEPISRIQKPSYLLIYSLAVYYWNIDEHKALQGFLWSWCENQTAAAIKLVPLGQTAGQKLLLRLRSVIKAVAIAAQAMNDQDIGALSVGLSMLSAQHEQQYSRLFRS